jgi:hypothetical protein
MAATVLAYIDSHLKPKDKERQKSGEIFTPQIIVDEMLDQLPEKVWSNPELKWLDPASGLGTFCIKAFLRLDKGLESKIPDANKRKKHIVENMLFMIDINTQNNKDATALFKKLAPHASPNIESIDPNIGFLADKPLFNIKQYDIVLGNPPYQSGAVKGKGSDKTRKLRQTYNAGQEKHKNLWIPFVKKILTTTLKPNGYLLFITPITWFRPERSGIHDMMLQYQIHKMRIIFVLQAKKLFGGKGSISVAHYLLQKTPVSKPTEIIDRYNNTEHIRLHKDSIIITGSNALYEKIRAKTPLFADSDDYKTLSLPIEKCNPGPHKQFFRFNMWQEIKVINTDTKHPDATKPKLILGGNHSPRVLYDKTGQYGLIGQHQSYFVGNHLDRLDDYFKTKLAARLLTDIKYEQEFIAPRYYPDVRSIPVKHITDESLAKYYGFTEDEQAQIALATPSSEMAKIVTIGCNRVTRSNKKDNNK